MTAGVDPADLAHCAKVIAAHGRTYHLASRLLPADDRAVVGALYAFARAVDDLVDLPAPVDGAGPIGARFDALDQVVARLADPSLAPSAVIGPSPTPIDARILRAWVATVRARGIDPALFAAFLTSMRMDLPGDPAHIACYDDFAALGRYMHGSAEVIGLQMLPVLGADDPRAAAPAAALGRAFQLTNFLRDIGEDLDRGRIYLPLETWAAFGVGADDLTRARIRGGRPPAPIRRALAHFIAHTRAQYRLAADGPALLPPRARRCVRAAAVVYGEILTEIELSGYRVFDRRATVAPLRRVRLATGAALGVRA